MKTELRQKAKYSFEKDFCKFMNNIVFGKTMEKYEKTQSYQTCNNRKEKKLFSIRTSELFNYHNTKLFTENVLAIEMKKTQILINEPVYLGLSISNLSKTVMQKFWYNYLKPKYHENIKLCYMDTDTFIVHVKTCYLPRHCKRC